VNEAAVAASGAAGGAAGGAAALPLRRRYAEVRAQTLVLAAPLSEADCQVQSMPEASPVRWHQAHVA